jgi:hypothetical protein
MRPRLSFANVVSVLALFVALGGSAYAFQLGKNSVGSKQLKKNAVTTAKVKKEAITAAKVKKGTLTGSQINASTLGQVPSAGNATTAGTASVANSLVAPEAWHVVGAPGEPQYLDNCQPSEPTPVKFFKDHDGVVHIEGKYERCTAVGATAFNLPPGYRPDQRQEFSAPGTLGQVIAIIQTRPSTPIDSGAVQCGNVECFLDGVTFRAES